MSDIESTNVSPGCNKIAVKDFKNKGFIHAVDVSLPKEQHSEEENCLLYARFQTINKHKPFNTLRNHQILSYSTLFLSKNCEVLLIFWRRNYFFKF